MSKKIVRFHSELVTEKETKRAKIANSKLYIGKKEERRNLLYQSEYKRALKLAKQMEIDNSCNLELIKIPQISSNKNPKFKITHIKRQKRLRTLNFSPKRKTYFGPLIIELQNTK